MKIHEMIKKYDDDVKIISQCDLFIKINKLF